jgi:hypothetical protein
LVVGMSDNKLTDMSLTTTATLCCGALNKWCIFFQVIKS